MPSLEFTDERSYPPDLVRDAEPLTDPGHLRAAVLEQGYHVGAPCKRYVGALALAASELVRRGLSPMWLLLADEVWLLTRAYQSTFAAAFPHLRLLSDHYVFVVDPADPTQRKGWSAHRDRPDMSFVGPDRDPEYINVWLALTDATAENGCMYVLPAPDDPLYATQDPAVALPDPQSTLAVPVAAGTPIFWTGRLIHWGGRSAPHRSASALRLALAFAAAAPDYETGLVEIAEVPRLPSLASRLALLFERLENYQHRLDGFEDYERLRAEHGAFVTGSARPRGELELRP